jgi:hypothetical protein
MSAFILGQAIGRMMVVFTRLCADEISADEIFPPDDNTTAGRQWICSGPETAFGCLYQPGPEVVQPVRKADREMGLRPNV